MTYSVLGAISRSALPKGGRILGLVEGYFDESEPKLGRRIFAVAGYLVDSDRAREMEVAWRAVLEPHGVQIFHMADCAADPGNGPFKRLTKDARIQIVTDLIAVIKEFTIGGVAVLTNPSAFDKHGEDRTPLGKHNQYSHCAMVMMLYVGLDWAPQNGVDGPILYNFEAGYAQQASASNVIQNLIADEGSRTACKYAGHAFLPKEQAVLLQAADLFAWQATKRMKDKMTGRAMRKDFVSLMEHPHHIIHMVPGPNKNHYLNVDVSPGTESVGQDMSITDLYQIGGTNLSLPGPLMGVLHRVLV